MQLPLSCRLRPLAAAKINGTRERGSVAGPGARPCADVVKLNKAYLNSIGCAANTVGEIAESAL